MASVTMKNEAKSEDDIKALVTHEIRSALVYDKEELSEYRGKAIDYFMGDMKEDTPAPPNRSSVVSKDVSDVIGWMLPGIIRTFMASGQIVEYEPVQEGDEEGAMQASDYVHHVFMNENPGYRIMYEATHDSLLLKNGIVKTWWDDSEEFETSEHTGIDQMQVADLSNDPDVEILAATEHEALAVDQEGNPVPLFDIKLKRIKSRGRLCFDVVEPENFGINREATTIEESRFTFHREEKTRSELIEMGFDREKVDSLPGDRTSQWSEEELARDENSADLDDSKDKSTQLIEVFECYFKSDVDGDGVAEMVRAVYAGNAGAGELLDWQIWEDDNPFSDIPCQPVPHRWDAISIADETMDLQRIKTVLTRQMLDNVYAHNNPQPEVEEGSVLNMQALVAGKFGQPVIKKRGSSPINWNDTPFIADKALAAVNHIDNVIERRTGVSRSTMALDPDALQNQTATAVQKTQDAAYSKIELIARNQAELGWKRVFKKALKIICQHQDRAKTIRLRGEWVSMDPRSWNADMDATINIGLGTGSRDRDMAMLQQVLQSQVMLADRFTATGMAEQAIQLLPKIRATMVKIGEAAGIRNADDYYPEYGEEEMQAIMQQMQQRQSQLDPKAEMEKAKMEADMQAKQADMQMRSQSAQMDAQLNQQKMQSDITLRREQLTAELELKREQLTAELQLKEMQIAAELQMKERLGVMNAQSASVSSSPVRMGGDAG